MKKEKFIGTQIIIKFVYLLPSGMSKKFKNTGFIWTPPQKKTGRHMARNSTR